MQINKISKEKIKNEQRKAIENLLKDVPDGIKIPIDKEVLESLMFEYNYTYLGNQSFIKEEYKGKTVPFKHIVWSGDFLSKIDLSKVSFDDVVWIGERTHLFKNDKIMYQYTNQTSKFVKKIWLRNTNANIDFSKSAFSKYLIDFPIYIINCDFSGTDLHNNTLRDFEIHSSNFDNTEINFSSLNSHPIFLNSSFVNCDFTNFKVAPDFFKRNYDELKAANFGCFNCNFQNTGMQIQLSKPTGELSTFFRKYIGFIKSVERRIIGIRIVRNCCLSANTELEEIYKKHKNYIDSVINLINIKYEGKINGCFINNKKILSKEENQKLAKSLLKEYQQLEQQEFDKVINPIKEQIHRLTKQQ